jgi:hypothetical protein
MPVTLVQAKLNSQDDIQAGIIDEFRKSSFILENLTFDDAVSPGTSGATLTYGYQRVLAERGAAFRAVNTEYTASEATKERKTVDLKVFGGKFGIDRILKGGGLVNELDFQMQQLVKSTRALFHDTFINGDDATNVNAFDGIDIAVAGTSQEFNASSVLDLSTEAKMESEKNITIDLVDEFLSLLDGEPTAIMGNGKALRKLKSIARRLGYFTQSENAFGQTIERYGNIALVDLGNKPASNNPVVPIVSRTVGTAQTGLTDLYAVRLGLDAVHGVSMAGQDLVQTWLPDFKTAGAVKEGEAEMVAAVAIKRAKSAAVLRNIKVQ